jgi:hypothetical protein
MGRTLGKDYDERLQSKKLRNLVVQECLDILTGKKKVEKRFKESLILKLAGNVLPRLTEVSGPEGTPIPILGNLNVPLDALSNNNNPSENSGSDQTDSGGPGRNSGG